MKTALAIAFLSAGALAFGQDINQSKPKTPSDPGNQPVKRLNTVTWDLETHKLVWTVQSGSEVDGKFVPGSTQKYEISPDDAVMAFSNEKRGFTEEEAQSLSHLLDVLSLYCAESVVWWDQGMGDPVNPNAPAAKPQHQSKPDAPPAGPKKVEHPPTKDLPRLGNIAEARAER